MVAWTGGDGVGSGRRPGIGGRMDVVSPTALATVDVEALRGRMDVRSPTALAAVDRTTIN